MNRFELSASRLLVPVLLVASVLSGCADLRPITEQSVTLRPVATATILGEKQSERFGICAPTLDRRGTGLFVWDEFIHERNVTRSERHNAHLTGLEVGISRGESCHLRILDTFQAAVKFDLSRLPSTAVVSARLQISQSVYGGRDAPYLFGDEEQCRVIVIGEATEPWESGIYYHDSLTGEGDGARPFIGSIPARIDNGPYFRIPGGLNITNTVSNWVRGIRTNHGFVINPDLEAATSIYRATDSEGFQCPLYLTDFELVVTVATGSP